MEKKDKGFVIENNVLKGTGNLSPEFKHTSLGEVIFDNLNNNPDFVGQVYAVTGEEYKYEKIRDRSVRCALWMKAQGLLPGDVITICTHNQPDAIIPIASALYLGAIFNPLDVGLHESDFQHIMKITRPKIVFVNEQIAKTLARVAEDMKFDLKIVVFGQITGQVTGYLEFGSIIAEANVTEVKNFQCTPIESVDQIAVIMCTSGTSGTPKGVALAHSVFLKQLATSVLEIVGYNLVFTSLAWYSATYNVIMSLSRKKTILLPPAFEERVACEIIEKYKIIMIFVAPSMINRLLKSDLVRKYNLSSLKLVICGGSPLSVATQQAFTKLLPNTMFSVVYAMTEVGSVIAFQKPGSKLGSCGQIWDTAQVRVIDLTTGKTLGPNQKGELLLKTNTMMNGYYNDPQATAETIDAEGWLHSGDIGYFDEDGEVYVVDRLKELIKYRSHHISPVEVENVLITHPGVKEVIVVGLPHPVDDEHPIAVVVRTDSSIHKEQVTEKELIDFVATRVADTKRLRGGVKFVDNLPKTPSSKIQRRDIRALAISLATK